MYNKNIFLDDKTPYYHDFTWNSKEYNFEISNKPIKIPKIDLPVISFSSCRRKHVFLCETQEILYFYECISKENSEFMLDGPYFIDVHKHIDIEKFPMKEIYCFHNSFYIIDIYGNLWYLRIKDNGNESYFDKIKKGKIPLHTENVKFIKNAPYIEKSLKFDKLSNCQKVYAYTPFDVAVLANNVLHWVISDGETEVIIENVNDCLFDRVDQGVFLCTLTEDWDEFGNNNTLYKRYRILHNGKLEQISINSVDSCIKIAHAIQNVKFVRKGALNGVILIIIDGKMYYGRGLSTQMNTSMLEVDEKVIDSFIESSDFIFFNTNKNNLYWFNSPTQILTQIKHESGEPVTISYPIQRRIKSALSSEIQKQL